MSRRAERAAELLAELTTAIEASDLEGVTVTDNPRKLDSAPLQPGILLLLPAPGREFPAPGVTQYAWTLALVGRPDPIHETWERLDEIVDVLRDSGHLQLGSTVEPESFPRAEDVDLPGYAITITEQLYE